jgi:hypothetical protein
LLNDYRWTIPGAHNLTLRIVFDPSVTEGKTGPLIDWTSAGGKAIWTSKETNSVIITCRGWKGDGNSSAIGQLATLGGTPERREKELTFSLIDSRLGEYHHVTLQLYTRPLAS